MLLLKIVIAGEYFSPILEGPLLGQNGDSKIKMK